LKIFSLLAELPHVFADGISRYSVGLSPLFVLPLVAIHPCGFLSLSPSLSFPLLLSVCVSVSLCVNQSCSTRSLCSRRRGLSALHHLALFPFVPSPVTQLIALYACRTVIIEKHYRTVIPRSVVDYFMAEVSKKSVKAGGSEEEEEAVEAVPVMSLPKLILVHIHRNDLYYLAVLTGEGSYPSPPLILHPLSLSPS